MQYWKNTINDSFSLRGSIVFKDKPSESEGLFYFDNLLHNHINKYTIIYNHIKLYMRGGYYIWNAIHLQLILVKCQNNT